MNSQPLDDKDIYQKYHDLISSTYPAFLRKNGIEHTSLTAEGSIITDSHGKQYIDCISGYGIFNIGHNHPKVIQDLITQLQKKQLFTQPLITPDQVQAYEKIAEITPPELTCTFLCNSGSEAIDSAIKLARLHTGKKRIITAENSYHGYTYGGLSATGIPSFRKYFNPLIPEIIQVPYNDITAIEKAITSDTAAILLEPIQHEAGVFVPANNYFREIRRLCDQYNVLLILDEIKTGLGKTGTLFACTAFEVTPDILVIGKSLGGGVIPIGAMIGSKQIWNKFSLCFPMSASSFAGNTLACRAAISTIEIIQEEQLITACQHKGKILLDKLNMLTKKYPQILTKVSGKGLLLGLKTVDRQTAFTITNTMIKNGVLVFPAYGDASTIMIEPSLVITEEQIQTVINNFQNVCEKMS